MHPRRSDWNPSGIPQVTIREARLQEFGPTPFPAYKGANVAVRTSSEPVRELAHEFRGFAYLLGPRERLVTRAKPGCLGTIERERVFEGERASWEVDTEKPWWWLEDSDTRWLENSDTKPLAMTASVTDWYLR
jgi:hypothetical protein